MAWVRVAQVVLISIPFVLFGWLAKQELVPSGRFVVEHAVGEASPFIDRILPDQRVLDIQTDEDGDTVRPIVGDPTFFFVHPHRGFETVDMKVRFKNDRVLIVELGGLAQTDGEVYDLKPLQNTRIDTLEWDRWEQDDLILLQREPVYTSIDAFLQDPPPRHEIATYQYELSDPYRLPHYQPTSDVQTIDVSLRGFHEFKTYIKDEPLDFTFQYMDMNRNPGADPVEIAVFSETGKHVAGTHVEDDGNRTADEAATGLRTARVRAEHLSEGVYKVIMKADRDIFFRTIRTPQQHVTFMNNVFLADEVGYEPTPRPVRFWTEAKHMAFQTQHGAGVQTLMVGDAPVELDAPYARVTHDVEEDGVVRVTSPKADVIVHTDGHIAFAPDQFFNPDPVRLRSNTDLDALGVNYVIARYTPPKKDGNWFVADVTFDTDTLVLEDGTWKFAFSTPGIVERNGRVDIGRVDMVWQRPPLAPSDIRTALTQLFE